MGLRKVLFFFGKSLPIVSPLLSLLLLLLLLLLVSYYYTYITLPVYNSTRGHRVIRVMQFPLCDYVRRVFLFHFARP